MHRTTGSNQSMLILFSFFQCFTSICATKELGRACPFTDPSHDTASTDQSMAKRRLSSPHPGRDVAVFKRLDGPSGHINIIINSFNVR